MEKLYQDAILNLWDWLNDIAKIQFMKVINKYTHKYSH